MPVDVVALAVLLPVCLSAGGATLGYYKLPRISPLWALAGLALQLGVLVWLLILTSGLHEGCPDASNAKQRLLLIGWLATAAISIATGAVGGSARASQRTGGGKAALFVIASAAIFLIATLVIAPAVGFNSCL